MYVHVVGFIGVSYCIAGHIVRGKNSVSHCCIKLSQLQNIVGFVFSFRLECVKAFSKEKARTQVSRKCECLEKVI